jgi:hypothetical protein
MPWTRLASNRFLGSAVFASVMLALLVGYQSVPMGRSRTVPVAAASPEMMQVLRDEHGIVATMVAARLATEKRELAARDRAGTAVGAPRTITR